MWRLLPALALMGCATADRGFPIMAWGTPASVAYWFDPVLANLGGPNQGHAAAKAQEYCQQYQKNAQLGSMRRTGDMVEVVFNCVAP